MAEFVASSIRSPVGRKPSLSASTTDLSTTSFPEYLDTFESPIENMADSPLPSHPIKGPLSHLKGDPSRHPSPQPTHFSVPLSTKVNGNGNGHKVLRSATVGYVAPEFAGKVEQMKQGKQPSPF